MSDLITQQSQPIKLATLGGGCFWCTEAIFQQASGVHSLVSGYCGGSVVNPSYHQVGAGKTGHAEAVQIAYDPHQLSFEDLLRIHFATHDPTTHNRQGADQGSQYRSIVFYRDSAEKSAAEAIIAEFEASLETPVVTEIKAFDLFYPAESEHQNYYRRNPLQGYCQVVIHPKLEKFKKHFSHLLKKNS